MSRAPRRASRRAACRALLLSAAPAAALLWPLLCGGGGAAARAQERAAQSEADAEGQGEGVDTDEPRRRHARPLVPLASESLGGNAVRPRSAPCLVVAPDGRTLLVDLVWEAGAGDRIEVRDVSDPRRAASGTVRTVADAPAEIVRPVAACDAGGALVVAWTQLVDGTAQLVAAREQGGGFTAPRVLTSGPLANFNPELARHDGALWIAWEADLPAAGAAAESGAEPEGDAPRDLRPTHGVLLARLSPGLELAEVVVVADGRAGSVVDPVLASAGGSLWVGASEWNGRDWDVRVRRFDRERGTCEAAIEASRDPRADDSHPELAAGPDGALWIGWDRVEIGARGESGKVNVAPRDATIDVQVRVARWHAGELRVPASRQDDAPDGMVTGGPLLTTGGGVPKLAVDAAGRLWVAYRWLERRDGMRKFGFPLVVQHLGPEGWSEPFAVEESVGSGEEPALVAAGAGVVAAFSRDERSSLRAKDRRDPARRLVEPLERIGLEYARWNGLVSLALARASAPAPAAPPPLVEPPPPPPAGPPASPNDRADPFVTGARRFEVARGGERYQVFFGDLHRHSNVSRCSAGLEPGPADRYVQARDVHLCDFFALTDHSGAITPADGWLLDKLGWLHRSPRFETLMGFEWSTARWGHHNVIVRDRLSLLVSPDARLDSLYDRARRAGAITIPHHPSHSNLPNDFGPVDDGVTRLVELYQACRGNFEYDGCFRQSVLAGALGGFVHDALQHGHEFGLIASTDHGYGQSYACVLAEELTRASLFAALHARRTYGATAKGFLVDFRIGEALVGETIEAAGPLRLSLRARAPRELVEVTLFKDGGVFARLDAGRGAVGRMAPLLLTARLVETGAGGSGEAGSGGEAREDGAARDATGDAASGAKGEAKSDAASDAPVLVVRAPVPAAPVASGPDECFGPVVAGGWRVRARGEARAKWTIAEDTASATLSLPPGLVPHGAPGRAAGDAAGDAVADPAVASIHLWANGGDALALEPAGAAPLRLTVDDLLAAPRRIELAGGVVLDLHLEARDATLDLARTLGTTELTHEWDDTAPPSGKSWYYARLVAADGEMAWSSPIFVHAR